MAKINQIGQKVRVFACFTWVPMRKAIWGKRFG